MLRDFQPESAGLQPQQRFKLVITMSLGVGLADWQRQGILERETVLYRKRCREATVYLLVPDRTIGHFREALDPIRALPRPWWCPILLYSLIGPLLHWQVLWGCDEVRCHNGPGVWTSSIARLVFGGTYVVRFGFIWSWDMARRGVPMWKLLPVLASEWIACRLADRIEVAAPRQADYLRAVHRVR